VYFLTPFRIDALLLGGLAALWMRGPERAAMEKAAPYLLTFCTVAAGVLGVVWARRYGDQAIPGWAYTFGLSLIDLFAAALIVVALNPQGPVYRALNLAALRAVGRVSYGAYVFHDLVRGPCMQAAGLLDAAHRGLLSTVLGGAATGLLAWLSFRFLETPFLRLKERWTVRR